MVLTVFFHYLELFVGSLLSILFAHICLLFDICLCPFHSLFGSFVPLPFINCITGIQLKPLKLLAHALCFSAFIFTFPHLEISVSCLSYRPRVSICCVSFKSQFKSQFLQGSSFDHLGWKEPYLSLNFQRITYGSYHILLCITEVSVVSQMRFNALESNLFHFVLFEWCLHNMFWMNGRTK